MLHYGGGEGTASLGHIGKIHQGPVGKTQRQIQIPQSDVAVQTQHPPAALGQGGTYAGDEGGLSRAALTGDDGDARTLGCHGKTSSFFIHSIVPL